MARAGSGHEPAQKGIEMKTNPVSAGLRLFLWAMPLLVAACGDDKGPAQVDDGSLK